MTAGTHPLSWTWLMQVTVLILFVGLVLSLLVVLFQRQRPIKVHVLTHEVNRTWEDVKAQIEERNPNKVEYRYTELAKERLQDQGVEREQRP